MSDLREIIITRSPVEAGMTYMDTAKLIKRLDPADPAWEVKASALIKRFTHADKLSVYSRLESLVKGFCREDAVDWIKSKVETHKEYYSSMSEEVASFTEKKTGIVKFSCPHCSGGVVPVSDQACLANYQCQNPECGQVVQIRDIKFENVDTIE